MAAIAASLIGFVIVAVTIWSSYLFSTNWRPAGYSLLIALAIGQVSVLLYLGDRHDPGGIRLLRTATLVAAGILTAMAVSEISSPGPDIELKGMAVASVVYGAGTIALVLYAALQRGRAAVEGVAIIDHVAVPVDDWERSGSFYRDVLSADARPAYADRCFAWNGSAASAIEHLHRHGTEILSPPTPREGAGGRGQSIYFHDPAGRLVELIAYG